MGADMTDRTCVSDLVLMLLMLVVCGLVVWWIHVDATEHDEHDPDDWP